MTTTGSLSRGCFVFKGKKKKADAADYFADDDDSHASLRCDLYQDHWEQVNADIQILQSSMNSKIFEDLLQFIKTAHANFSLGDANHSSSRMNEIPTAGLITGVNTPDHSVMFTNLLDLLMDQVTPHLAVLKSKDCANTKQIMTKITGQLMGKTDLLDIGSDNEDGGNVNVKKISCTMPVLSAWYNHLNKRKRSHSPKKRKSTDGKVLGMPDHPPVVIVLEDLESFNPHVLQDFISTCSNYLDQLPLVLVFGIATAVTAVHRLLPHQVSSLLCLEKFHGPPSTKYLTQVVKEVVMTPKYPFKLGSKVFQLLLDIFLYHDFSVMNYVGSLQFCIMDHFHGRHLSSLCCSVEDLIKHTKKLTGEKVEKIRQTPSFMRYVECQPPAEQIRLLEDDNHLKLLPTFMHNLETYHSYFFPVLECLNILTAGLPKHPLGKQTRELYHMCLQSQIVDREEYKEAMGLLRAMSRDELLDLVQQCTEKLLQVVDLPEELQEAVEKMLELASKFDNIEELANMANPEEDDAEPEPLTALPKKKMSMKDLQQKLQEIKQKKKKLTVYEAVRNEAIDYFELLFRQYLRCYKQFPLHEAVYYDAANEVKKHMNASPRAAIHTALSNPYFYLQNDVLKQDTSSVTPDLPDICIVYKLHLECGRLINLYDWLQAFIMIVTATEEKASSRKPDKTLQARFIRAVSELQFLGFIKPTKRKTDHVARLTWGGY
ncbi:origin recognition complex subunit 3-like isoform X2 [Lineus longissimus]|uniref:origin recognition complex subunit 3-like isoform X2 n=1 Tax=Lineus longissimus TaxID=88925 RepID=UPI00315DEFED